MIDPNDYGVIGLTQHDLQNLSRGEGQEAFDALASVISLRPSLAKEISVYRKWVPVLLKKLIQLNNVNQSLFRMEERYENDSQEKKYKKWTDEEDLLLIELVCTDISILELSTRMGRTPGSIKTRLSKLVGLKRISQDIAGKFIGNLNGEYIEGDISGTLYK